MASSSTEDALSSSSESAVIEPSAPKASEADEADEVAGQVAGTRGPAVRNAPKLADCAVVLRHSVRGTAHFGHKECADRLGCGKPRGKVYMEVGGDAEGLWPRCSDCFPEGWTLL